MAEKKIGKLRTDRLGGKLRFELPPRSLGKARVCRVVL
jgi:hypothetical protein